MKRKLLIFMLVLLIIISAATPALAEPGAIYHGFSVVKTVINGQSVEGDVPAVIINGRTTVPLRVITEAIGGNIRWDDPTHTVYLDIPGTTPISRPVSASREITAGNGAITSTSGNLSTYGDQGFPVVKTVVNGRSVESDVPAVIINGRTMVPLRVITEALGGNIRWDAATHTVYMDIPGAVPGSPALTATDVKTIRIGVITSTSGDLSTYGNIAFNAFRMAVEDSNNKAGDYKIEFVTADDRNDPQEAAAAAKKLITVDKVSALVGPLTSECAIDVAEVASQYKIPMITPTASKDKVTVNNGAHRDYVYRACFADPYQGTAAAKFALENLKLKTAVVLYDKANDYSIALAEKFRDYFTKNSGQLLLYEGYQSDTNFSALLDKVAGLKPDLIYLPDYYQKVSDIAKQARAMGMKAVFLGSDGWNSNSLDMDALEGGYFTNHFAVDDPRPEVQQWVAGYKNKYGTEPDAIAALSYDATKILLQALTNAKSADPVKINEALMNIKDFPTLSGKVSFDANGDPLKPVTVLQINDSKFFYYAQVTP